MKKIKKIKEIYGKYVYRYYKHIIFIILVISLAFWFFGSKVIKVIDFILFVLCLLGVWGLCTLNDIDSELFYVKERMRSHEKMLRGETPMMDWEKIVIRSTMLLVLFLLIIFIMIEAYEMLKPMIIRIGGESW